MHYFHTGIVFDIYDRMLESDMFVNNQNYSNQANNYILQSMDDKFLYCFYYKDIFLYNFLHNNQLGIYDRYIVDLSILYYIHKYHQQVNIGLH